MGLEPTYKGLKQDVLDKGIKVVYMFGAYL